MKGIILAGGLGSRLYPLTYATNKHLLPVYDMPMIFYPIQTLVAAGIDEIMIVTGGPHAGDFVPVLRNGRQFGVRQLEYAYQEDSGGIAQALSLTETFADGEPVCVILGDNTTDADIGPAVADFRGGATIFLKEVSDPERFGCPVFADADPGRIVAIEEKPRRPQSRFAVTGLYIYDPHVYDFISTLEPSARGELEITDVNNRYLHAGQLCWHELDGYWSDAGTFESLFRTNQYWAGKRSGAVASGASTRERATVFTS